MTEVNGDLATSPEKVNKDAHGAWMLKMTLKNPGELDALLSAADYEKFVAEEGGTLKLMTITSQRRRALPTTVSNRTDLELHLINFLCAIYQNLLPTAKPC